MEQNQIQLYLVAQLFHDFNVKWFKPVSVGVDEVEAAVDSVVDDVLAVETALVAKVPEKDQFISTVSSDETFFCIKKRPNWLFVFVIWFFNTDNSKLFTLILFKRAKNGKLPFELVVNVTDDLLEAVRVVNGVAEAWRVNDGEPKLDSAFFNLDRRRVQLNRPLLLQLFGRARNDAIWTKLIETEL